MSRVRHDDVSIETLCAMANCEHSVGVLRPHLSHRVFDAIACQGKPIAALIGGTYEELQQFLKPEEFSELTNVTYEHLNAHLLQPVNT